jgi:hypothetical protein
MTLKSLSLALASTALVALTLPVLAQDKSGTNAGATPAEPAPAGAATLGLAQELYAAGVAAGDPVLVLAAAKLAASVEATAAEAVAIDPTEVAVVAGGQETLALYVRPKDEAPKTVVLSTGSAPREAGKATVGTTTSEDEGDSDAPATAEAMFAMASELAAGDEAMLALIEDAMAESSRGRIGGAVQWLSRLPAGQTDVWEIPFYGNSYAEIAVVGDGDTDLDIAITDENGNVFCYDVSWSDSLYCDFTPAWDGYFYVTVQNLGNVRNSYYLLTN